MRPSPPSTQACLDSGALRDLLRDQEGVIARHQVVELGGVDADIARWVRRRELSVRHPGVYVVHTGPLTARQLEWVAVLGCWPAALCHTSALPPGVHSHGHDAPSGVVHVAVARDRGSLRPPAGVRLHRVPWLDERVDWHRSPPRQRVAEATLDVAAATERVSDCFGVLAAVCNSRLTTPSRLGAALDGRSRIRRRGLLRALIDDVTTGANSVLERDYLVLERRHGLPRADRQRRDRLPSGSVYRDAPYTAYGLVVELDGAAHHTSAAARDRDAERDLDTQVTADVLTVRLTGAQVWDRGCVTIAKVAALLTRRGWDGPFLPCPRCRG